jgi:hypothetical protein
MAHGPGERDRFLAVPEQIEDEGGLLQRVGSLGYDGSGNPIGHGAAEPFGESDDVGHC